MTELLFNYYLIMILHQLDDDANLVAKIFYREKENAFLTVIRFTFLVSYLSEVHHAIYSNLWV